MEPVSLLAAAAVAFALPFLRRAAERAAEALGASFWDASNRLYQLIITRLGGELPQPKETSFSERMRLQTQSLQLASDELDSLLTEMKDEATTREVAVSQLERKVVELAEREQALQSRVEALSVVSPRAVQEFVSLLEQQQTKGERRSARRDYILFALGVVFTIVLTILFNVLGLGG